MRTERARSNTSVERAVPDTRRLPAAVGAAILAAVLFGASTPFAKLLLERMPPVLLAGLLYLGSGCGLTFLYLCRRGKRNEAEHARADTFRNRLDGPAFAGGIAALKYDDDAQTFMLHPFLEITKPGLEFAQFLLILFALHRFSKVGAFHKFAFIMASLIPGLAATKALRYLRCRDRFQAKLTRTMIRAPPVCRRRVENDDVHGVRMTAASSLPQPWLCLVFEKLLARGLPRTYGLELTYEFGR